MSRISFHFVALTWFRQKGHLISLCLDSLDLWPLREGQPYRALVNNKIILTFDCHTSLYGWEWPKVSITRWTVAATSWGYGSPLSTTYKKWELFLICRQGIERLSVQQIIFLKNQHCLKRQWSKDRASHVSLGKYTHKASTVTDNTNKWGK